MNEPINPNPRPTVAPSAEWLAPRPRDLTLANGLAVQVFDVPGQQIAAVQLALATGALADPDGQAGLAYLTASALTQGAGDLDENAFAEALDEIAADLGSEIGWLSTQLECSVPVSHLGRALDLMASALREPQFADEVIGRLCDATYEELMMAYAEPSSLAAITLERVYFPDGTRWQVPVLGDENTISALTPDAVRDFYARTYGVEGALLVVAGDFSGVDIDAELERTLGTWQARGSVAFEQFVPAPQQPRLVFVDQPGLVQSQVLYAAPSITAPDPRTPRLQAVMHAVSGSPESILWDLMRTQKGYTYGCQGSVEAGRWFGRYRVVAAVETSATAEACRDVIELHDQVRTAGLDAEQIGVVVEELISRLPMQAETAGRLAGRAIHRHLVGLGPDYPDFFAAQVRSLTSADSGPLLREGVDLDHAVLIVVGDRAVVGDEIEQLPWPVDFMSAPGPSALAMGE